jgi:16S rRNA processing protein RimM
MIAIGKIVAAVGLRGEVKVLAYSDNMARFAVGSVLRLGDGERKVEGSRLVKRAPVLKLEGIGDRTQAEALRGVELFIGEDELAPLPDGVYYVRDLKGCAVTDEGGAALGTIRDVIQNGAQDLYEVVAPDGKAFLIPAVAEFILRVDIGGRRVEVRLPEGLAELAT